MRRFLFANLLTCVLALTVAASAHAEDRSGSVQDPSDELKILNPATAVIALKSELIRRYGLGWEKPGSWTACPVEEFFPEGLSSDNGNPQALCEFRFPTAGKWRHGSVLLTEQLGEIVSTFFSSSTFAKAMRACPPLRALRAERVFDRGLRAGGWVGCRDGGASVIRDLHGLKPGLRKVSFHGTNRAGFEDAVRFRCVLRARPGGRRTATCANRLGDRFIYRFRLGGPKPVRKAGPRRPPSRPNCTPGYSVCMSPGRGDYDCRGGDGDGPNYVSGPIRVTGSDPYDLDRDKNGVACED